MKATAREHAFTAHLSWRQAAAGPAAHNHRVVFPGRPPIEVSAAPQYRGDPTRANPEELFLAALASCQMLTYLALAARAGIEVASYDDDARATLAIVDRRMRIASVVLRPRIALAPGQDAERARSLVAAAHAGCFVANSVSCPVVVEAEIAAAT